MEKEFEDVDYEFDDGSKFNENYEKDEFDDLGDFEEINKQTSEKNKDSIKNNSGSAYANNSESGDLINKLTESIAKISNLKQDKETVEKFQNSLNSSLNFDNIEDMDVEGLD